jgi:MYXO-CTERM domain-containing protein
VSEQPARVMPASRQPVSEEHEASAMTEGVAPPRDSALGPDDGVPATNPVAPTTSAAAATDTDAPIRTATWEDATKESVRAGEGFDYGGGMERPSGVDTAQPSSGTMSGDAPAVAAVRTSPPPGAPAPSGAGAAATSEATRTPTEEPSASSGVSWRRPAEGPAGGDSKSGAGAAVAGATVTAGRSAHPGTRGSDRMRGPRSPQQIERDIEAARGRLASTVDEINERVKPANVAQRAKVRARAQVVGPDGSVRTERVGPAVAAVAALVLLAAWRRRRRRR